MPVLQASPAETFGRLRIYLQCIWIEYLQAKLPVYCQANIRNFPQPQRPTRTLRVFGDENAVPTSGSHKTLHQRNKSSPALSTMLNAGGLKLAARRTAFGDVSNTVNVSRPSKDDSEIGGKGDLGKLEKPVLAQQDKKTTSLLRPAQRPLSVSGLKSLINHVPIYSNQLSKQPLLEVQVPSQAPDPPANTRKITSKKSTAVFKDDAISQVDQCVTDLQKSVVTVAPIAPVHRELLPKPQSKAVEPQVEVQPRLTRQQSKLLSEHQPQDKASIPQPTQTSSEEPQALRSDGIYIDEQGQVRLYDYIDPVELPVEKEVIPNGEISKHIGKTSVDQVLEAPLPKIQPARKSALTTVSEPEEYWDHEGEENYDEEGYVTARSFKSRGDNTTGGATTVLFPKVNLKAKKEIAAAKELIEGSKTAEELEDEAWDTTMVAEYGEEILQYMKDLEVMNI